MSVFRKTNPVDLDLKIDAFQDYLFTTLMIEGMVNVDDWNCYDRIYSIPADNGLLPFRYVKDKDYARVLYDDKLKMSTYFYANMKRPVETGDMISVEVSLVVQANILDLFPSVVHRADEELKNKFSVVSRKYPFADDFKLTGIEEGISNVYSEFDKTESKLSDVSQKHVFRLKYKVRYTPKC